MKLTRGEKLKIRRNILETLQERPLTGVSGLAHSVNNTCVNACFHVADIRYSNLENIYLQIFYLLAQGIISLNQDMTFSIIEDKS